MGDATTPTAPDAQTLRTAATTPAADPTPTTDSAPAADEVGDGNDPSSDDARRGGHADRAPRSLTSVELAPDDEDLASNEDWDESTLL